MIQRIVVPVDFSDASCRAAQYAVDELAPQLQAEVVLVTVLDVSDLRVAMKAGLHGFETDEELHRQVEQWIGEQFARIESKQTVTARRDIRRGDADHEILEAIREHKADLVVMGATGINRRSPMGSKPATVLKYADVPLLLVRATGQET